MKLIKQLGALAFGTRLRLLTDTFIQDGAKIYRSQNIDFEPRWFPVFYLLSQRAPLTVTDIANELGYTQPAVTQTVNILLKRNIVKIVKHSGDTRKKMLALSPKGMNLLPQVEPVWESFDAAIGEMFNSTGQDILFTIEKLENAMNDKSVYSRVTEMIKQKQIEKIDIVNYSPECKKYFRDLNYRWLKKYFKVEKPDRIILNNPETEIISKGGSILFAKLNDEVIGTCALIKHDNDTFELSKMAVDEKEQGKQAGKKLSLAAIAIAKANKAKVLFLHTSTSLLPAINLYKKLGFVQTQSPDLSGYNRPTIKMELRIE